MEEHPGLCEEYVLPESMDLIHRSSELATWLKNTLQLVGVTKASLRKNLPETVQALKIHEYLEAKNFRFDFQGIFDANGALIKGELLARLDGPSGTIVPHIFIPMINEIGHKAIFDYLVIEKAFEAIARIRPPVPCAININPTTFENGEYFLYYLDRIQGLYGIDPKTVILEILESEAIGDDDYDKFNQVLSELRKRWYKIAVDDFHPVGNHNMLCIERLGDIDTVKFDGIYMCELYARRGEQAVTQELKDTHQTIMKRHPLIDMVVENIENQKMFEFFRDLFHSLQIEKVDYQGYYFHKGSNFAEFLSFEDLQKI